MTTFLKSVFGPALGTSGRAPSFNDFSLHVGRDAESELDSASDSDAASPPKAGPLRSIRTNVWQDTFSPQMNSNMKTLPGSYYDRPSTSKGDKGKTVWGQIIKSDTVRDVSFHHFDCDRDGLISAEDLKAVLGPNADVHQLIKEADKNRDGKIDQAEFCELLKNM